MNDFVKATWETLLMVGASSFFSVLLGLPLGVLLVLRTPSGMVELAPEVLIDGGEPRLVRRRQTFEELTVGESIPE